MGIRKQWLVFASSLSLAPAFLEVVRVSPVWHPFLQVSKTRNDVVEVGAEVLNDGAD